MGLMKTVLERTYDREANDVFQAFYYAVDEQPGWRGLRGDSRTGVIDARTGVGIRSWGEVIQVFVQSLGPGKTLVTMSSRVKMQLFDWGKNKQNIERVFSEAEARLSVQGAAGARADAGVNPPVPPPPA